jgi:hypothetical protein
MSKKPYRPEEINVKQLEADVPIGKGKTLIAN